MSKCNDPDHNTINAERQETRDIRADLIKAWDKLSAKRVEIAKLKEEIANLKEEITKHKRNTLTDNEFSDKTAEGN